MAELKRGERLMEDAIQVINGDRQDQYGNPEDSFRDIAVRWEQYLKARGKLLYGEHINADDVAFMMADLKMARECHQSKRDNRIDQVGYMGILDDMVSDLKTYALMVEKPKPLEPPPIESKTSDPIEDDPIEENTSGPTLSTIRKGRGH
jgi:hypothetical protein